MAKIKRGSLVIPEGSTAERVKRKKLVDAIAKRRIVKRKMKSLGEEAGVFIAKARKAKVAKEQLTAAAKETNNKASALKKAVKSRKLSLVAGGGTMYFDGYTNPMTIRSWGKKSKYTTKQLQEIPKLQKAAGQAMAASKGYARKSGGTATGIKRTAEAALGRIAEGKALKGAARKAGILGMVGMFMNELNGKKKRG
jgi:hypothetical protein